MSSYLHKDEYKDQKGDIKSFFYLLRFAAPFKGRFILALSLIIATALFSIYSARMLGYFVEDGLIKEDYKIATTFGIVVIVLEALSLLSYWLGRVLLTNASSKAILFIRKTLFKHIHRLPISYYDRTPLGRTVTRITHDVEGIEDFFSGSLGRMFRSSFIVIIAVVAMVATDLTIGLILILSMLPAVALTLLVRKPVRLANREMARRNSAINARLSEFIGGINVIRILGLEKWSKGKFDQFVREHLGAVLKTNLLYSWSRPLTSMFCNLPLVLLLFIGGGRVFDGTLSIGLFVVFIRYCERFSRPIIELAREVHSIQQAFANADRITQFLKSPTEVDELGDNGTFVSSKLNGDIRFNNLHMEYVKGEKVLQGINFQILAGMKAGIVGETGSGKSTLVNLITRLYNFQQGEILLDGRSILDYDRSFIREQIGYISQEVVIFEGTIRDNLLMGKELTDEKVLAACSKTGLCAVFDHTGMNLNTPILDQGANLSVGERQVIALTRVLIEDPAILIMDEATANVDPFFEELIHEAVNTVMEGRTCLIIAHRLSTLKSCDRLFVFSKGELKEQGTHEELIVLDKYYNRFLKAGSGSSKKKRDNS